MYHENENITFLLNATYTKILIHIEKMFGPGPTGPYGSYAYGAILVEIFMLVSKDVISASLAR